MEWRGKLRRRKKIYRPRPHASRLWRPPPPLEPIASLSFWGPQYFTQGSVRAAKQVLLQNDPQKMIRNPGLLHRPLFFSRRILILAGAGSVPTTIRSAACPTHRYGIGPVGQTRMPSHQTSRKAPRIPSTAVLKSVITTASSGRSGRVGPGRPLGSFTKIKLQSRFAAIIYCIFNS